MTTEEEAAFQKARHEALRSVVHEVRADLICGVRNPFRRRAVMLAAERRLYTALYTYPHSDLAPTEATS